MQILGVDYGRKKVGLAIANGPLAEPYSVIRYEDTKVLIGELQKIIEENKIEKLVVGISEGQMAEETKIFLSAIRNTFSVPVETFDETLSTQEAQTLSIEAGLKKGRRKSLEDAFAAAVILQNYLDFNTSQ